jgi:hypothetical protein
LQRDTNQKILQSVPTTFAFPPGDSRLRAINGSAVSPANRYRPLIRALDAQGTIYGDAALSSLDYVVQYRDRLDAGNWVKLQDLSSASTHRSIWFTNTVSGTSSRFYRLRVGP